MQYWRRASHCCSSPVQTILWTLLIGQSRDLAGVTPVNRVLPPTSAGTVSPRSDQHHLALKNNAPLSFRGHAPAAGLK